MKVWRVWVSAQEFFENGLRFGAAMRFGERGAEAEENGRIARLLETGFLERIDSRFELLRLEEGQAELLLQTRLGRIFLERALEFANGDGEIVVAECFDAAVVVSLERECG